MEKILGTFEEGKYMLIISTYGEKENKIIKENITYYRTKKQLIKAISKALEEDENIDTIGILTVSPKSEDT